MARSAAAAFAWEFRQRLRWGSLALGGYLLVLVTVRSLVMGPRPPIQPAGSALFAFTVSIPLIAAFFFIVSVFSYGLSGDLAGRTSLYPARLFTLPATTAALAGYPMLYGSLAMAGVYVLANAAAVRPAGVHLPWAWPPVFLAAFLAWMQVFIWMPYGLRGLRVIVAVLSLFTLDAVALVALEYKVREPVMIAVLAPLIPLAYLAARHAVGRARHGDVPDWAVFPRRGRIAGAVARAHGRFPSARRAQLWFEWRQHGRSLPAWVAIVLPFELALLYVLRAEPAVLTIITLIGMVLTPSFLAAFTAATVSRSSTGGPGAYGVSPFLATRPLTTARLVAAKLEMALASTLVAGALVLVALALGAGVCGAGPVIGARLDGMVAFVGRPRATALLALGAAALLVSTWKQLVQGMCVGLTGREWLIKGSVLLRLCSLMLLGPALHVFATSRDVRAAVWDGTPWIVAALACVKVSAAAWTATRLSRTRLFGDRALAALAAAWLAAVVALFAALAWLFDTPHLPRYFLLLLAVLAVPLVRPSAAALALAWNRHRGTQARSATAVGGARPAVAAVFVLFALPVAVALALAASFHARNRNNGVIVSSGVAREYQVYVPKSYDPSRPTPLVISMHGAGMWPAAQRETSRWNAVAEEHGFIVVYPSGSSHGDPRVWHTGSSPGGRADVRFISDLIDRLQVAYTIDSRRIYADGFSNGGGMAFVLSCTLSDRIAAVSLVGSAQLLPWSWCTDERPVPMIAFHGTADRFAPYLGGTSPIVPGTLQLPGIPAWAANWARRNRCGATATDSRIAADVTRRQYTGCADDATVALYTIEGGGHTWPGGERLPEWFAGATSTGVDASRQAWAFFAAHPLAAVTPAPGSPDQTLRP